MKTLARQMIEAVVRKEIAKAKENNSNLITSFGVSFIKKDGSHRTMNCMLGVKKHLKGGKCAWDRKDHPNLLVVYDVNAAYKNGGYRTINLNTIYRVAVGGVEYSITD